MREGSVDHGGIAGHQAFLYRSVVAKGLCVEAPHIAEEIRQMRQAAELLGTNMMPVSWDIVAT